MQDSNREGQEIHLARPGFRRDSEPDPATEQKQCDDGHEDILDPVLEAVGRDVLKPFAARPVHPRALSLQVTFFEERKLALAP